MSCSPFTSYGTVTKIAIHVKIKTIFFYYISRKKTKRWLSQTICLFKTSCVYLASCCTIQIIHCTCQWKAHFCRVSMAIDSLKQSEDKRFKRGGETCNPFRAVNTATLARLGQVVIGFGPCTCVDRVNESFDSHLEAMVLPTVHLRCWGFHERLFGIFVL